MNMFWLAQLPGFPPQYKNGMPADPYFRDPPFDMHALLLISLIGLAVFTVCARLALLTQKRLLLRPEIGYTALCPVPVEPGMLAAKLRPSPGLRAALMPGSTASYTPSLL